MYKILEMIENMDAKEIKKEKDKVVNIRHKLIHELRLIEETIRKVGAIEQLIESAWWEKTEGLGEKLQKEDPTTIERITEIEELSFDELKKKLVDKGLL